MIWCKAEVLNQTDHSDYSQRAYHLCIVPAIMARAGFMNAMEEATESSL